MDASPSLRQDMKELAEKHGLTRVEVQYPLEYEQCGHQLRDPHSLLYLPGLGWTMKNDLTTSSWSDAKIVGRV